MVWYCIIVFVFYNKCWENIKLFLTIATIYHTIEILIDQLPMLNEMRRTLEELSIMTPPEPSHSVILEQVRIAWFGVVYCMLQI